MKHNFAKAFQFVFFLSAGLVLLYFAFRGIDLNELLLQIRHADYRWVAFSAFFGALALVFRTFRWRLLIEPLDMNPKLINILHAINIGYLANFLFPRIGEITRCAILNRTDRVPADKLFGTVVVERIFDLLMSLFMLCLILLLRFDAVSSFILEHIIHPVLNRFDGVWGIGLITVLIALLFFVLYIIFRKKLLKINLLRKVKDLLNGVVEGIKSVKRLRKFKFFMLLNVLVFGAYLMQTYVMFFALESASSLGLGDALFVLVLSAIAIILPVQGGIGAYHWIVSMGLTILGLSRADGMVYATISHSVTSLLFILLGAMSVIFVFYRKALFPQNKQIASDSDQ